MFGLGPCRLAQSAPASSGLMNTGSSLTLYFWMAAATRCAVFKSLAAIVKDGLVGIGGPVSAKRGKAEC